MKRKIKKLNWQEYTLDEREKIDTLGYEEEGEASASRVNRYFVRLADKIDEIIERLNNQQQTSGGTPVLNIDTTKSRVNIMQK